MNDVTEKPETIKYDLEKVTLIADSMVVSLAGDNLKNEVIALQKEYPIESLPSVEDMQEDESLVAFVESATKALKKPRLQINKDHKVIKAPFYKGGKLIDKAKNDAIAYVEKELHEDAWKSRRQEYEAKIEADAREAARKEEERVKNIKARLEEIRMAPVGTIGKTSEVIKARLEEIELDMLDWAEEVRKEAQAIRDESVAKMRTLYQNAVESEQAEQKRAEEEAKREAERLEAERKAEEARKEQERKNKEEAARLAKQQAEIDRQKKEVEAARKALQDAEDARIKAEQEKKEAEERAAKEKAEAEAARIAEEKEKKRLAKEGRARKEKAKAMLEAWKTEAADDLVMILEDFTVSADIVDAIIAGNVRHIIWKER